MLKLIRRKKLYNIGPRSYNFFSLSVTTKQNNLECLYFAIFRGRLILANNPFMSLNPGPVFTTLHILITYRLDQ
jgi:hypothetical protein